MAESTDNQSVEHFVVIAGRTKEADSDVVLVSALSARQAHDGAATEFRRKRHLASNVHVQTVTAYRSARVEEAELFVARLFAEMDAKAQGGGSTQPDGEQP